MSTISTRHAKRIGVVGTAAAGLLFWTLSELALAPSAHADDPINDLLNNVHLATEIGSQFLTQGGDYLAVGDITLGTSDSLTGLDNLLIAPAENILVDSLDALSNTPVATTISFSPVDLPSDWASTMTEIHGFTDLAHIDFMEAANFMTAGDIPAAEFLEVAGFNALWVDAPNAFLVGLSESLFPV